MLRRTFICSAMGIAGFLSNWKAAFALSDNRQKLTSLEEIRTSMSLIADLHETKKPSEKGDWLAQHQESGQTLDEYLSVYRARLCLRFKTIYIQPLGEFTKPQEEIVNKTIRFMRCFFGMPVETLNTRKLDNLPKSATRTHPTWKVNQVLSTHILDYVLKPHRPKDALAVLGLTATDLWPGKDWNFVFGQASLSERVGVWSFNRNGNLDGTTEEQQIFLRRTLKTAVHEKGHMLGIPHCIAYECGMNGSNSLQESDRQRLEFCPECQAKVAWACGSDFRERYQSLATIADEFAFKEERDFWKRSLSSINV